jgi:2-keto-4-pentenoate hydratase
MKKQVLLLIVFLFAAWTGEIPGKAIPVPRLAEILVNAHQQGRKIPVLSLHYPELDFNTAYQVQKAYVERRLSRDRVAGFKGGLTAAAAWERFGLNGPVTGVLFASGKNENTSIIDKNNFGTLMIETEIGFVIAKPLQHPLEDETELREYTREVMPVIELPDLGFADMQALKGVDIIAANVGAVAFITGPKQKIDHLDIDSLAVTLNRDGKEVNRGKAADVLSGQRKAALWLIDSIVNQGWKLEPGHIIITGALGRMIPGTPGNYTANWGELGTITFTIK